MESTSSQDGSVEADERDVFNICISTDNHCGYKEEDPIIGDDSFLAFEEVLETAVQENSDFLLLGGDLFHEKKPSRKTVVRVTELLNKHVFGYPDIQFETDQYPEANYIQGKYQVQLPVYIIHGNHDDPIGCEWLSNIDPLHSSHQLNYFGKNSNVEKIQINPILFTKGKTKIALYGLGNMRDERLNLAKEKDNIFYNRPLLPNGNPDESYFNILVLHQNRFKGMFQGVPRRYAIVDTFFPPFFNLIIWGHEHECIKGAEECVENGYYILQPGSSVATSLIEAESVQKHSFQLIVYEKCFKLEPRPLKCTRPILYKEVNLGKTGIDFERDDLVEKHLLKEVKQLLRKSANLGKPEEFTTPLARIKVEYSGYTVIRNRKFKKSLAGLVANPDTVFHWYKKPKKTEIDTTKDESYIFNEAEKIKEINRNEGHRRQIQSNMLKLVQNRKSINMIGMNDFMDILESNQGKDLSNYFKNEFRKKISDNIVKEKLKELGELEKKADDDIQGYEEFWNKNQIKSIDRIMQKCIQTQLKNMDFIDSQSQLNTGEEIKDDHIFEEDKDSDFDMLGQELEEIRKKKEEKETKEKPKRMKKTNKVLDNMVNERSKPRLYDTLEDSPDEIENSSVSKTKIEVKENVYRHRASRNRKREFQ
ncbi:unnamed protein product [Moneuplotes crassus]|uniref:Double-strand break repair protein n=1 Tax=Euplotes crassus TaxID=5936 RepID=A0AAD1U2U6_EUPCR|nr:unnamed protein product [Moneuplotes crassus]